MAGQWAWPGCKDSHIHRTLRPFVSNLLLARGKLVARMWVPGWTQRELQAEGLEEALSDQTLCVAALLEVGRLENLPCSLSFAPWLPNSHACSGLWQALSVALCGKWQLPKNIRWKEKRRGFLSRKWAGFESCALGVIKKERQQKNTEHYSRKESKPGVSNLWDLMPADLRWSWWNDNTNEVCNRCNVLESSRNHHPPHPNPWKNCLPRNQSLVPKK